MKIIIYDNDKKFLNGLRETFNFIEKKYKKILRITLISNIKEKIIDEANKPRYDVREPVLVIINPDIDGTEDGIELAKKIRKINSSYYIVFVSNDDYVRKTLDYEIRAFNYFYKPIGNGELTRLVENIERDYATTFVNYNSLTEETISITTNYKKIVLPIDTIIACEYKRPKTIIYTTNGNIEGYFTLKDLQDKVEEVSRVDSFLKVHKAITVNFKNAIEMDISKSQITMIGDLSFPIARGRKKDVSKTFNKIKTM